ncbi:MAG: hypothetical protein ACYDCC_09790 [Actinomycetota bacterium]
MKLEAFLDSVQGAYQRAPAEDVARAHIAALAEAARSIRSEAPAAFRKRRLVLAIAAAFAAVLTLLAGLAFAGVITWHDPFGSLLRINPSSQTQSSFWREFEHRYAIVNSGGSIPKAPVPNSGSVNQARQNGEADHGHQHGDRPEHHGDHANQKPPHGDSPDNPGGGNCQIPNDVSPCLPSPTQQP